MILRCLHSKLRIENGNLIPEFRKHYRRINAETKTLVPLSAFVIIFCNEIVLVKSYIADVYQLYCFCCENEISCLSFRLIVFVQKHTVQLYHNHIYFQKFVSISWYFDNSSKKWYSSKDNDKRKNKSPFATSTMLLSLIFIFLYVQSNDQIHFSRL